MLCSTVAHILEYQTAKNVINCTVKLEAVAGAIDKLLGGYWLVKNVDSPEVRKEWRK